MDKRIASQVELAEALGRRAFEEGRSGAAALDKGMMEIVAQNSGHPIGTSSPALEAFLRGWDRANLAA